MKRFLKKCAKLLHGHDSGTVMINFMFCLPILLAVIGVISQYTLLVNARLTVDRATAAAARTAMTALPTDPDIDQMDGEDFVNRSARLALEPISAETKGAASSEAQEVGAALRKLGVKIPDTFEARYTTAENVTTVDWQRLDANEVPISDPVRWEPRDFARNRGQKIKLTIHFKYYMTVPVIGRLMGTADPDIGLNYTNFDSSIIVQLSPGRMAQSDNTGWAQ